MKLKIVADWKSYYDWMLYPAVLIGFRTRDEIIYGNARWGAGIGFLFLKGKIQLLFLQTKKKDKSPSVGTQGYPFDEESTMM